MLAESLAGLFAIQASDLVVTDPTGAVQILGTDYEVTGNLRTGTASIRTLRAYTAGVQLTVTRRTQRRQDARLSPTQPLPATKIEAELDRRALIEQEIDARLADLGYRALLVPIGEGGQVLPSQAARTGKFLIGLPDGSIGASSGTGTDNGLRADLLAATGGQNVWTSIGGRAGGIDKVAATAGVPISFFGAIGTADDSLVMQAAIDALDGTGYAISLTGNVTVRGNVYFGDTAIRFNGFAINVIIDGAFTQRGAATYKNEGVLLTKSGGNAGYGRATVAIEFLDRATINVTRAIDTGTVKTGVLLENTRRFAARTLALNAVGTGTAGVETTTLDFFQGVQGVSIDTIISNRAQGANLGGIWCRNFSTTRMTRDIHIGAILFSGDGVDEFVAIYNSGSANADLSDIHIGSIIGTIDGGSGVGVSIFRNAGAYDDARMRNITIGTIKIEVNSLITSPAAQPFAVKLDKCAARVGKVEIEFNVTAWPGGLTGYVGLRGPNPGAQAVLPYVGDYSFRLNSVALAQPGGSTDMAYGALDIGRFAVRGAGSGFKYAGRYLRTVADARINDVTLDYAFDGVESVTGYVEGRMNNVYVFKGIHVINTDRFTAANWWFHNAAALNWNNAQPTSLSYDAEVRLIGAGTVSRIVFAQSNPTNPVPVAVRYRASNPNSLTISNPDTVQNKAYFPSGQYSAVLVTGSTIVNRGRSTTLTVTAGKITPVFDYHLVGNGATVSDIDGFNGLTPGDGQELWLSAGSGSFTIKHNTGSAGTKTFCSTAADITVNDVGFVRAFYKQSAARWEVRP